MENNKRKDIDESASIEGSDDHNNAKRPKPNDDFDSVIPADLRANMMRVVDIRLEQMRHISMSMEYIASIDKLHERIQQAGDDDTMACMERMPPFPYDASTVVVSKPGPPLTEHHLEMDYLYNVNLRHHIMLRTLGIEFQKALVLLGSSCEIKYFPTVSAGFRRIRSITVDSKDTKYVIEMSSRVVPKTNILRSYVEFEGERMSDGSQRGRWESYEYRPELRHYIDGDQQTKVEIPICSCRVTRRGVSTHDYFLRGIIVMELVDVEISGWKDSMPACKAMELQGVWKGWGDTRDAFVGTITEFQTVVRFSDSTLLTYKSAESNGTFRWHQHYRQVDRGSRFEFNQHGAMTRCHPHALFHEDDGSIRFLWNGEGDPLTDSQPHYGFRYPIKNSSGVQRKVAIGTFVNMQRHGFVKLHALEKDGVTIGPLWFRGQFERNQRNGYGESFWSRTGQVVYAGEYVDDKRHGQGCLTGVRRVHTGAFERGAERGYGECRNLVTGQWVVRGLFKGATCMEGIWYRQPTGERAGWFRREPSRHNHLIALNGPKAKRPLMEWDAMYYEFDDEDDEAYLDVLKRNANDRLSIF